ncbi:calcium/sodium antiporter [Methanoplanus limicola]|uniref:Na+/Ca+ antiporter, CaCA family n=1 Tax=Methanoplanus limicola DSM 2279 TaxID=937775 RepID=H1YYH8_9EURY|nr:calcium/sodium antiporter [Methanoplanus limicola]EHQ35076.1 Na+/Ca+ antiporter, CaCA family [Methanoplanus limicola DSM 2279]
MIIEAALFVTGLIFLVKGADYFVEGGGGLASRYGVSPSTIGLTVIAFGTSLPEFVVSINAILSENQGIALGNIVGSNIANIGFILAFCAAIKPGIFLLKKKKGQILSNEAGMMIAATLLFLAFAATGTLTFTAGIAFLALFVIIMIFLWKSSPGEDEKIESHGKMDFVYLIGGVLGVIIGSQLVVNSSTAIAEMFGVPSYIIGVSMVAIGTSLPEFATSAVAIWKNQGGISIGNILGSNIFNLLFVMGIGVLIRPIEIASMTDIFIMAGFSFAALLLFIRSEKFIRALGILLLISYSGYIWMLFA